MDYPIVLQLNVLLVFISNFFSEGGYLPTLSICSNRTEVLKDEHVLLQCRTSCSKSILWTKDNINLRYPQTKQLLMKTSEKDSGLYQCQCENQKSNTVDLKVKEVIIEVTSQTVTEGDTVTFYCLTKRNIYYYDFYKDQRFMIRNNGEMTLNNVAKTHEGEYYCVSYQKYPLSLSSSKIHLRVSDFFQSVTLSPHPGSSVSDTSSLSLLCDSHPSSPLGQAEILYSFYHGSQIQAITHQPWYNISHVQYSVTGGKYHCVASIEKKNIKKESNAVNIHVQALPLSGVALQTWPRDGRVSEGSELVLGCSVDTSSSPMWFSWYRSRNKWSGFESGNLARRKSHERTAQIVLTVMNETDSGNYNCLVSYEDEMEVVPSQYVNISVLVSVTGVNLSISTSNHNTTLLCSAESLSRYLVISWIKDGAPLSTPPSLPSAYVTEQEKLHIDTSQSETHGTYWCSVHNEMLPGNCSWSNTVQVFAHPGATHTAYCVIPLSLLALISIGFFVFWKKHSHSKEISHSHVPQVIQEENRRDSLGPTLHYNVQQDDIVEEVHYAAVNITQKNRGRRDGGKIEETSGDSAVIYSTITHPKPSFNRLDPLYSNTKSVFN
ncbi:Fc receptor-like protein 4 isoform X2 [Paramormyrops kingsleyae]|uniref:Fc receptor-like protein 4 isoform X2 n=1 Tax=Paramormyrops kingsleyae TaxID=1676925 RepID=UPI000CD65E44|nr:hemicentin-1-like isoform X2 [Paramormyrops kingsleyae]